MKNIIKLFLICAVIIGFSAAVPAGAQTTTSYSIESIGSQLGLGNADLKTTTFNILNLALGLLALVAVVMIIVSVIVGATNSDHAEAAKRALTGAIIGLVIVLLAWATVFFVARTTANVTVNS